MLATFIRKELLSHLLSLRFAVTFALFLVLIITGSYVSTISHLQEVEEHGARVRSTVDHLDKVFQEEDDREMAIDLFWRHGIFDTVDLAPLTWLGQGMHPGEPVGFHTYAHGSEDVELGLTRNPLLGLVRPPDLVYLVSAVLSLLAIIFVFDAICGEKEAGSLRLVLSNSVPRHTILLAKWIGGYCALIVPFLIAVIAGIGYAWTRGVFEATPDNMNRIIVFVLMACVYIAVFFNIGLFVSTCTSKASTSLLSCLLIWVCCIIVVPNIAPVTARILKPTPTLKSIKASKGAVEQEYSLKIERVTLTSGSVNYGNSTENAKEALEAEKDQKLRELDRYFEDCGKAQTRMAQTLGRISPAACWTYAAISLTGTGPDTHVRLEQSKRRLEESFNSYKDDFWRRWRVKNGGVRPEKANIPTLKMTLPSTREAMNGVLNDFLILAILNVVFFMLGFTLFLRYDAR